VIQQYTYPHWSPKDSCICPSQFKQIKDKDYSKTDKCKEEYIASVHDEMDYENITGFVACDYDTKWWVGCVLNTEEEEIDTVEIIEI
jgi:hypothetical protein